jgi:hypothetical protein
MKIIKGLGLPYMGSKRKIAPEIVDFMLKENPNATTFVDLFGGGAAISLNLIQRPQIKQVFYNEFNTGVVRLLEDIRDNGITDKYFQWISRETFMENKNKDTWLGGLCKVVWSFGNNQKDYLFAKDIEEDKRLLHHIVVNECEESLKAFNKKHNIKLSIKNENSMFDETMTQRRLRVMGYIKKEAYRCDLQ